MAQILAVNSEQEIQDLRVMNLFSERQLERMVEIRKQLGTKINSYFSKDINDYKEYIEHESLILAKIRKYRYKKKILEKTNSVDSFVIRRIIRLYEIALKRFPSEYSIHQDFFEFCKKYCNATMASQAIDKMLKIFSSNPEVWKEAADWYHGLNDVEKASQAQELYSKALELKLCHTQSNVGSVDDQRKRREMCYEKINNYVDSILSDVNNLQFLIQVLSVLEQHKCTVLVELKILEHLLTNHVSEDSIWHMMAQREKAGLHYITDPNEEPQLQDNLAKSRLFYCVDKYKQGLSLVAEEKKKKLWFQFIDTLLEIKEENQASISSDVTRFLKGALEQAHSEKCLEERYYMILLNNLPEDEAGKVIGEATTIYPTNEELWKMRMRHEIMTDKVKRVESTFKAAVEALKERAINMWLMRLKYHCLSSEAEKIEAIYEEGIRQDQPAEISNVLKPKYIVWMALQKDMTAARKKYREIAVLTPYCKELHAVMSKLEIAEMNVNYDSLQKVHDFATEQFGSEDLNVFSNYVKFILFRKPDHIKEKLKSLYADAERRLPPLDFQQFRREYQTLLEER